MFLVQNFQFLFFVVFLYCSILQLDLNYDFVIAIKKSLYFKFNLNVQLYVCVSEDFCISLSVFTVFFSFLVFVGFSLFHTIIFKIICCCQFLQFYVVIVVNAVDDCLPLAFSLLLLFLLLLFQNCIALHCNFAKFCFNAASIRCMQYNFIDVIRGKNTKIK